MARRRPGGRVALSDVLAEVGSLPEELRGALGQSPASVKQFRRGHIAAFSSGPIRGKSAEEDRSADALELADRIVDRLRGAKLLGLDDLVPLEGGAEAALELAGEAREAIADGRIGYTLVTAR